MNEPNDQAVDRDLEEVRRLSPSARRYAEGGNAFILFPSFELPAGSQPQKCDLLLCTERRGDGYESRLFFSERVTGKRSLTWTESRVAERQWYAYSYQTAAGLRPLQQLLTHLGALG